MKKIVSFAAGLLLLAACQEEAIITGSGAAGDLVSISAQLPGNPASKAVGEGENVNRCILEIYNENGEIKERQIVDVTGNQANFQAKLTEGENYQIVLWADHSEDGTSDTYYDTDSDSGLKNISRLTTGYTGNNDKLDAFFANEEFTPSSSESSVSVTLKRPFAQLNIYASDMDALLNDEVKPATVSVTFNSVYTSFNAAEGIAGNEVSLSYANPVAIIGENAQMSYDYLFAPDTESILNDFTMHFYNAAGVELPSYTFTNIPIQRNYRTHVTGDLQTVDASLNVVIKPEFEGTLTKDIYDGNSVVEPYLIGTTYDIKSAANLAYIMQNLNLCAGKTLDIQCDMDFANASINSYVATFNGSARINVNGNGKTIENLVLNGGNSIGGFIPEMGSGTIKDLTFDNLTVKVATEEDAYVGGIVGRVYGNLVITNCNVLNSNISGVNKIGGIVGFVTGDASNIEITNCRVENTTISGKTLINETQAGDCGGIVGYIQSPNATITGNYVLNSTLSLTNVILTDDQVWGRGMSLYVGTCSISNENANIVISADADATQGSKRVINGTEDGGLVRYKGLLGNIRNKNLPATASLVINGEKVTVDESTDKEPVK